MAELQGRECYFFKRESGDLYTYVPTEDMEERSLFWDAFDIPNPNELFKKERSWPEMTSEEREALNKLFRKHSLEIRPDNRADPLLIQVVEELGKEANGRCADLKIVEIPDGIKWHIEEYDGSEHVAEDHEIWS